MELDEEPVLLGLPALPCPRRRLIDGEIMEPLRRDLLAPLALVLLGVERLRRGFKPALRRAGLDGKGITIHDLRSAAISLYAARGLSMLETAMVMGQADPGVTWKHYARLFDRSE